MLGERIHPVWVSELEWLNEWFTTCMYIGSECDEKFMHKCGVGWGWVLGLLWGWYAWSGRHEEQVMDNTWEDTRQKIRRFGIHLLETSCWRLRSKTLLYYFLWFDINFSWSHDIHILFYFLYSKNQAH